MNCSKYDMRVNPVYQVDFSTTSKGKRLAATKRRVRFSFGFSNPDAIENGLKGIHCRGEEHEVNLVWSLTSGKRIVTADGEEVHFSVGKRSEMQFECSWTMKGNHVVKLVAHAAPAFVNPQPGFRQYELFLDGMSFFIMPKIYELGVVSGSEIVNRGARAFATPAQYVQSPRYDYEQSYDNGNSFGSGNYIPDEECHHVSDNYGARRSVQLGYSPAAAVSAPVTVETRRVEPSPPAVDLMSEPVMGQDFLAAAPSAPVMDQSPAFVSTAQTYQAPAQTYHAFTVDEFTPVAPPPASYNDVSNQILSAYGNSPSVQTNPAVLALPYESHTYHQPVASPQASSGYSSPQNSYTPQQDAGSVSGFSYTSGYFSEGLQQEPPDHAAIRDTQESPTSVRQLSALEKAMQDLVNFDDISEPAMSPMKLTMAKEKEEKKNAGKSRPLPPKAAPWQIGSLAPLADIQANAGQRAAPSKEVMRTHAFDPAAGQAGMLVVYGATPTEAPPLQHVRHPYGRAFVAH